MLRLGEDCEDVRESRNEYKTVLVIFHYTMSLKLVLNMSRLTFNKCLSTFFRITLTVAVPGNKELNLAYRMDSSKTPYLRFQPTTPKTKATLKVCRRRPLISRTIHATDNILTHMHAYSSCHFLL